MSSGATRGVAGDVLLCPGEEENLDDMLESHEFRRELGDGDPDFGMLPFGMAVLSIEVLEIVLENPGLCGVIALGSREVVVGDGSEGSWPLPLCKGFSGGEVETVWFLCVSR